MEILAKGGDMPGNQRQAATDCPNQGGFPSAIWPNQGYHLAWFNLEGYISQERLGMIARKN
jgi:hypothetical protein